ncbi:glycosyltransferase family 2 protein [Lutibacter maritimus]|uniref:Glycosyl transferase family 2 n=1 Tax=Lutibacter maritimus TaxID=593133 RepID=A0A1I6R618_9FLAO|nr:glycosyltransferase [Lutibacter maritimus]SFS60125.1 Glycosyl transferase family 2 [Lutibacter maritimus]
MISILIPVYNYNVSNLVNELHKQLNIENVDFEIICIDDCSSVIYEENLELSKLNNTKFFQLPKNIGRSKIRNLLVFKAKFEWLIFLDSDVIPEKGNFIKNYMEVIRNSTAKVFCGGLVYESTKPESIKILRWVYGRKREQIDTKIRKSKLYQNFFTANILINKSIFNSVKFNESIVKYGYEDVLFAQDLKTNKIDICHIDNRVFHLGLENSFVFLNKTKESIENLLNISSSRFFEGDDLKLYRIFKKLKKYKVSGGVGYLFYVFKKLLEINLTSGKPSLLVFDMYKLGYLCYLNLNYKSV